MKDGDQIERDGKKYRVGWFQLFEKPHPSRQKKGKLVIGYGHYYGLDTKRREGDVFAYDDGTYDLVARKARKESHT